MKQTKYWSGEVAKKSNALDIEQGVFTWDDPKKLHNHLKNLRKIVQEEKQNHSNLQ